MGLAKQTGKHSELHNLSEIITLLKLYAHYELHSWWLGRSIDEEDVNLFPLG